MHQTKLVVNLFFVILIFIFSSFLYDGIINKQPYSSDYNVPIAKSILAGDFLALKNANDIYIYSPGSSHAILALFLFIGLPNLFGVLSLVFLFYVSKKLGDVFGLNKSMAIIFAASVCTIAAVIRTVGDQSIDKWLCSWFVLSIVLLEKPQHSLRYFALLGFSLGMLIGTKYSGPLFFIALLPLYAKTLFRILNPLRLFITCAIFTIFGLLWYIRNFILTGNPYYPANLLFFKGIPDFTQQDWMLWRVPIEYPEGIIPLMNAFLSEYMIWTFSGFVVLWYLYYSYRNKKSLDSKALRLINLALTTGLVSLLLPITPPYKIDLFHIISDMRYVYIFVILLMLAVFLIADKYKMNSLLTIIALLNAIPIFSFIPYQPKIFVIVMLIILILYYKRPKMLQKFYQF